MRLGLFQTNLKDPDSKRFAKLKVAYEKQFNKPLSLGWFVAVGYDSVRIIAEAIRSGGSNSVEVKDQLYKIRGFEGASSEISFTAAGSSSQYVRVFQVEGGKFRLLADKDPS